MTPSAGKALPIRPARRLCRGSLSPPGCLLVVFLGTTLPFLALHPFHWDGAQFVLGVRHYSVVLHQPHPPGYPLFIGVAKLFHLFLDPHRSLQLESLLFALGAVGAVYLLGLEVWGSRLAATAGSLCLMLNPLFWLYRETGLTYTVDAFAASLLCLLLIRARNNRPNPGLWAALFLGLAGGFRPSVSVLLLPLLLAATWQAGSAARLWKSAALWGAGVLAWLLPMLVLEGVGPLLDAALTQFAPEGPALGTRLWLGGRIGETGRLISHLIGSMNLLWLSAAVGLVAGWRQIRTIPRQRFLILSALWWLPPLFFFSAIHFGQIGYLVLLLPLPCLLTGGLLAGRRVRFGSGLAVGVLLTGNIALFATDLTGTLDPGLRFHGTGGRVLQGLRDEVPALFGLNQGVLAANDRRLQAFRQCVTRFSPSEVAVIAGPAAPSLHRVYWPIPLEEVYRNLAAELPAYHILQPSGEAGAVFETYRDRTMAHRTVNFELPASIRHLVVTVDALPAACSPAGIQFRRRTFEGQNCFEAEVSGPFSYCGIRFEAAAFP